VRRCERSNSADTKLSEEGGRGGARDTGAESLPLQLVMKSMVRQVVHLQPMEVHDGSDIHPYPWKGPLPGASLLAGLVTPWETHAGAACS